MRYAEPRRNLAPRDARPLIERIPQSPALLGGESLAGIAVHHLRASLLVRLFFQRSSLLSLRASKAGTLAVFVSFSKVGNIFAYMGLNARSRSAIQSIVFPRANPVPSIVRPHAGCYEKMTKRQAAVPAVAVLAPELHPLSLLLSPWEGKGREGKA